jgi:hypothetical protein
MSVDLLGSSKPDSSELARISQPNKLPLKQCAITLNPMPNLPVSLSGNLDVPPSYLLELSHSDWSTALTAAIVLRVREDQKMGSYYVDLGLLFSVASNSLYRSNSSPLPKTLS